MKTLLAGLALLVLGAVTTGDDPYRLNPAVQPLMQQLDMTLDPNLLPGILVREVLNRTNS